MSRLCVLICRVDDEAETDRLTELSRIDVSSIDAGCLSQSTALDALETKTLDTGRIVMRRLLAAHWHEIDEQLVAQHELLFPPRDGETRWT